MGDLRDCIEKATAERQCIEQEVKLRRLGSRIDDLQEQITELKRREAASNVSSKRPFPRYGFTEWLLLYGYQNEDKTWVIEETDVVDWLKRCGLEDYI